MADSDKDILITPNVSQTSQPEIKFVGKDNSPVYLKVLDDNTLSFEGTEGQVFSIGPTMSSGTIFSVNDISGVPSITVDADGTIKIIPNGTNPSSNLYIGDLRHCFVYARGTGNNNAANSLVYVNGEKIVDSATRGLTLTIINQTDLSVVSSTNYDTYANQTNNDNLATAIGNMTDQQIGILVSEDAWESTNTTNTANLRAAATLVGLTKLGNLGDANSSVRRPYAAIFMGSGDDANAANKFVIERMSDADADAPMASVSAILVSDGTHASIMGSNNVSAIWGADSNHEEPALIADEDNNIDILGGSGGNGNLNVSRTSGSTVFLQAQSATGVIGTSTNHDLSIKTNDTTRLHIENSGEIGIGITAPTDALHIRAASDHPLVIENTTNAGYAGIQFSDNSTGSYAQKGEFRFNHADGSSEGSGASFHFTTTESDLSIVGGKFIASDSSASEPGFAFSGDVNTGLFQVDSDDISLVTVGSRRLTVTNGGEVLIGATSMGDTESKVGISGKLRVGDIANSQDGSARAYLHVDSGSEDPGGTSGDFVRLSTLMMDGGSGGNNVMYTTYALRNNTGTTWTSLSIVDGIRVDTTAEVLKANGVTGSNLRMWHEIDPMDAKRHWGHIDTIGMTYHQTGSGRLGIGTTSPTTALDVNGSITVADNIIHSGDTNNTISFGTDTQSFNTGSTSRMNISDSGLQVGTGARVTTILDEDNMASNSSTALATQQSIKAYVDSQSGGGGSPAGSDSQVQYNNGGSFGGDADFTWDDTNNRLVIGSITSQHDGLGKLTVKGTDASFLLEKHDDSASGGPTMTLYRYSASVADGDLIGQVNFRGEGSTGNPSTYISMRAEIEDTTEGTKDAALIVRGLVNNTQTNLAEIHGAGLTLNQGTFNGNMGTTTYKPSVYMDTGTQNVNQTEATLGFNSEVLDPASNASSTTDGHIRLAAGGYYRISYSIPINDDGSTGGDRTRVFTFMQVDDNNSFTSPTTVAQSRAQVYTRENSGGSGLSSSFIYQHTANDYIRLRIDAEGTTDISTESNQSQISIEYLGPA
jgi:hypothetical protein